MISWKLSIKEATHNANDQFMKVTLVNGTICADIHSELLKIV